MSYGLYLSAAGARAQSQRLEVLSNNLANVDTPGFKRELAVNHARHSEAIEQGDDHPGSGSLNNLGGGVGMRQTVTDFSRGILQKTDVQTDVAIKGEDGFFLVQKDGEQLLTRAGNFQFTRDGRLITQQGFPVLAQDGNPISINPQLPWQWSESGELLQGNDRVPLAVVKPAAISDLENRGENLFQSRSPLEPLSGREREVASGYVELSSVQPALEMMHLIEASRAYEVNVRMIQNQDHIIGELISRVLRQ